MPDRFCTRSPEWRCRNCGTLLGVATSDYVEVRYKTAVYRVRGELATDCRKCGTPNRIRSREAHPRHERSVRSRDDLRRRRGGRGGGPLINNQ